MNKLPWFLTDPDPTIYLRGKYATLDFETTDIDYGWAGRPDNKMLCSVAKLSEYPEYRYIYNNEYNQRPLIDNTFHSGRDFLVAHNAMFESQWLFRCGVDPTDMLWWDTKVAQYIIRSNRNWKLDLETTAKYWGVGRKTPGMKRIMDAGISLEELPKEWVIDYCAHDVAITEKVFKAQVEYCHKEGLLPSVFMMSLFVPVLAMIEMNGIKLDRDVVRETRREYTTKLNELEQALLAFGEGVNWNSSAQKREVLFNKLKFAVPKDYMGKPLTTSSGALATNKKAINALKPRTKKQQKFLDIYKERTAINSLLTKNIEYMYGLCEETQDAILYGQFNNTITATGRTSCSGRPVKFNMFDKPKSMQLQNLPNKLKKCITARNEEWLVVETDGSQIEFRCAAFHGQDAPASKAIREKFDVHKFTASILHSIQESEVTKDQRKGAKAHTFKPLYGGTSGTEDEQRYYAAFRERYPFIAAKQQGDVDFALQHKYIVTPTGYKFYFPDCTMTRSGYVTNTSDIYNYPIQRLATGEIIPINVTYQYHRMKAAELRSFLVNTVHDSSLGEVHPDEIETYKQIAIQAYTKDAYFFLKKVYNLDFNVRLGLGINIATHWGEGDEISIDVPPEQEL